MGEGGGGGEPRTADEGGGAGMWCEKKIMFAARKQ